MFASESTAKIRISTSGRNCQIAWTLLYDEVVVVLEGTFKVRTKDGLLVGEKGDVLWLPDGAELQYEGDNAFIFYAVQPGNWKEVHSIENP
ncbi:hypothetical protein [Neptunomonas marina]|uniref:DUF861 domain-containing protein n=1 Tax=Neptunomonas marina TaxID=1815562 RepID=A0A437Q780_9GAMM|nr:hypothetical protein [Neptunomonas marina]RVU30405.1 hypothetical protein EOE65_12250 [Neptunomonas marina]